MGAAFFCGKTMELLIITALILLLVFRDITAYRERQLMLDRLMAKSLPEYKDNQKPEDNTIDIENDETVPLEDAEEELTKDER